MFVCEKIIPDMQNGMCSMLLKVFAGITPNYTAKQLDELEDLFEARFAGKEILDTTIIPFGFYYGETLVRTIPGAHWSNLKQQNPYDITVTIPIRQDFGPMFVNPFRRFYGFHEEPENKPSTQLWLCQMLHQYEYAELIEKGEPMTDGWYKFPGGHVIRLVQGEVPAPPKPVVEPKAHS